MEYFLKLFLYIAYKWMRTPWPCTSMAQIYTCLRTCYVCPVHVTPFRVLHNYRAKCLTNKLSSTRRTRLNTNVLLIGLIVFWITSTSKINYSTNIPRQPSMSLTDDSLLERENPERHGLQESSSAG